MRSLVLLTLTVVLTAGSPCVYGIDARIVQVRMPDEDVTVFYYESSPVFTVKLQAKSASVEGITFWVGNNGVAVELRAHPSKGLFFQGEELGAGHVFKKGSMVKVLAGFKRVADLAPGTVYVELPGVTLQVPGQQLPAKAKAEVTPRIKVELRWAEFKPVSGVTQEKGRRYSCGDGLIYWHKNTILTNQDVADARLAGPTIIGGFKRQEIYHVNLYLTEAGKRKLAKSGRPGAKQLLVLLLDGQDSGGAYWVNVADLGSFVPWTGGREKAAAEKLLKGIR